MAERVPITLFTHVNSITSYAAWSNPGNPTDPWVGYSYQWELNLDIRPQTHSDITTPRPFTYNGLDVQIGDWVVFTNNGIAVQIINIDSPPGDSVLTVLVEDVGLSNILNDPGQTGQGIGSVSPIDAYDCLIIRLNSSGVPVFASIPDYTVPINLIADITNRFQFRNYVQDFIQASQPGNTFSIGDVIYMDSSGNFHASISTDLGAKNSIGTITSLNQPGEDDFTFRPSGRYVQNLPTLPGSLGQLLYVSSSDPGKLTATAPTDGSAIPVYIKISATSAIMTSGVGGGGSVSLGNLTIIGNTIGAGNPNGNIILSPNGNGKVLTTSNLDVGSHYVINILDPVNPQDAATKHFVEISIANANVQAGIGLTRVGNVININNNQPTITGLGNITSGTWSGNVITYQRGGTGLTSLGNPFQVISVNSFGTALTFSDVNRMTESDIAPTSPIPIDGDRWFNTDTGILYTRITDVNGSHWVEL